jgi:ubiquinone biosynthesis monooxygenase Coq6
LGWDYNAQGVVATLKLDPERPESKVTAWQRFLPTGPIAMLPVRFFFIQFKLFFS